MATALKAPNPKPLPAPNADFYHFYELLLEGERKVQADVRTFMETKVQPIINDYWIRDEFPFELLPEVALGTLQILAGVTGNPSTDISVRYHFNQSELIKHPDTMVIS